MAPDRDEEVIMTQFAIHTPVQGRWLAPNDATLRRRPAFSPSIFFESPGATVRPMADTLPLESVGTCDGLLRSLLDRFIRCGASPDMPEVIAQCAASLNVELDSSTATSESLLLDLEPGSMVPPPAEDSGYQQGSSCHQCKSRRQISELSFCNNVTKKRSPLMAAKSPRDEFTERSHCCRKKYCDICLKKFYGEQRGVSGTSWPCPSCRLICSCAACRRQKLKARNIPERFLNSSSPATAVACSIVYFGNEIGELLGPDALKLAAPQAGTAPSPVRTISFRNEVVQASVARPEGVKRVNKKTQNGKPKRLKLEEAIGFPGKEEADAESERVEKEATAEAAILLASLRTVIPNTISAS